MVKEKVKNLKREASPEKKKIVHSLVQEIKNSKTILIASTKGLPSSQFHSIKKNLRGKADIKVVKRTAIIRAIDESGNPALRELENVIKSDVALFFSSLDAFELSGVLSDNQSPAKAKAGDIAPEDIVIEPGPTDLLPGPAISELSGVGLKVAVEGGKLAIKIGKTVANKGEAIKDNVAAVLAKLGIAPMKVGFEPIAAYDSVSKKVYVGIKIDKKAALEALRECIAKAAGLAINIKYLTNSNVGYFIAKAGLEEKAISNLINKSQQPQGG
jgi:large subunit ribosomal protein L10